MKRLATALFALAWGILSFLLSSLCVSWLASFLPLDFSQSLPQAVFSLLIYLLSLFLSLFVYAKVTKTKPFSRAELGLSGFPTWLDIALGIAGLVVSMLLAYLLNQLFTAIFPWYRAIADQAQDVGFSNLYLASDRIIAFISLVVVAPLAEEVLFRGWIYGKVRQNLPLIPAILLTSLAFAVLHGQWNVGLTTFALSLVLCALRETTGTIYAGIILHMLNNALAFWVLFIY